MQSNQRTTAGLIALLMGLFQLGFLGIHKFVMGYNRTGWLWILLSLCTCFIAAVVLNVISIIEGVIYLTMSDEQFHQTYVVGRKKWF